MFKSQNNSTLNLPSNFISFHLSHASWHGKFCNYKVDTASEQTICPDLLSLVFKSLIDHWSFPSEYFLFCAMERIERKNSFCNIDIINHLLIFSMLWILQHGMWLLQVNRDLTKFSIFWLDWFLLHFWAEQSNTYLMKLCWLIWCYKLN